MSAKTAAQILADNDPRIVAVLFALLDNYLITNDGARERELAAYVLQALDRQAHGESL